MKIKIDFGAVALIIILFAVVGLFIFSLYDFFSTKTQKIEQSSPQMKGLSRMSLTSFDRKLGIELMDQNHDGRCDICGMPVEQCTDSGQLECNMDPNAKIGILGSQHVHADWKVYINGKRERLYKANGAFKGIWLPAGQNIVELKYEPWGKTGVYIFVTIVFSLFLFFTGFMLYRERIQPD